MPLRTLSLSVPGDPELGKLSGLPGIWSNADPRFANHGWNIIALPFGPGGQLGDFRLLLNQYNEELIFSLVDKNVPNRGQGFPGADQHLHALQYVQAITQFVATDAASQPDGAVVTPVTPADDDTPKGANFGIHREPGLFLQLVSQVEHGLDLARLATIPHGDAVLALGHQVGVTAGPPEFNDPKLDALFASLPTGAGTPSPANVYTAPWFHFTGANKFQGLLDPTDPKALFTAPIPGATVKSTQTLVFSTEFPTAGIHNIPFVHRNANAVSLHFALWLLTLDDGTQVLKYFQNVSLKFLPRADHTAGLIAWPHISFNTLTLQPGS